MQLKIPKIVDDYNHNMNGVDIADQMRSNYSTQRTHRRTWLPLFYWCLDTALINAMLIMKLSNPNMEHKDFRMSVAASLLQEADDHDTKKTDKVEKKRTVVKANTKLPSGRFIGSHIVRYTETSRRDCFLCRWLNINGAGEKVDRRCKTNYVCLTCNEYLCVKEERNCFEHFHTKSEKDLKKLERNKKEK